MEITTSSAGTQHRAAVQKRRLKVPWLAVPVILGALSLLTAGYLVSFNEITIADDHSAKPSTVRTHQRTVEGALREAGVTLFAEDIVSPPRNTELKRGDTITVQRALLARLYIGSDQPKLVRTHATTVKDLFAAYGASIGERDAVMVNGAFTAELPRVKPQKDVVAAEVKLKRAVDVNVAEAGKAPLKVATTADTVGEALMQAGNIIYLADVVVPALHERIAPEMNISIQRSKPASIVVDGRRIRTRTQQKTVADLLSELNIALYDQDYTKPALDTPVSDEMEVKVVRLRREVVVEQDLLPFDTRWQGDPAMELDTQVLAQEGAPGVRERRTLVTFEDGATVKKQLVADFIAREIQPKIYKYGTQVVVRTLQTPNGPVEYWRKIRMLATSYSATTAGVPTTAAWYGKTRCGFAMRGGIVAIDPRVIPLRSNVYVDGYGPGYACDTGSAIKGKRIDLGYSDEDLKLWYRWTDVYVLTPVPATIDYVLED